MQITIEEVNTKVKEKEQEHSIHIFEYNALNVIKGKAIISLRYKVCTMFCNACDFVNRLQSC